MVFTKHKKGRCKVKKIAILALCAMFAVALFSDASSATYMKALEGQKVFTRTNLRSQGSTIFFHNMSQSKGFIPVGTAVIITKVGKEYIKFEAIETGKKYTLRALSDYYDRYFVKDASEIGLKNINSKIMKHVENMEIVPGMTKEEAYISRGCPAFIGWGVKSWLSTLGEVMGSDTWYYNAGTSKIEMLVTFKNGVVAEASLEIKKRG